MMRWAPPTGWAAILVLAIPITVAAAGPDEATADACDEAVSAWAKGASRRTGLDVTPVSCPGGLVRFKIAGAGCDFEVRRGPGFQHTEGGAFGVSPIVDLDWDVAPEPMKKGLAGLLTALTQDSSLLIPATGHRVPQFPGRPVARRNEVIGGLGAVAVLWAAAFGSWWRRRKATQARLGPPPPRDPS